MLREKMTVQQYEERFGPLPTHLRILGAHIVRHEFPLTNDAEVFLELPVGLPVRPIPTEEAVQ